MGAWNLDHSGPSGDRLIHGCWEEGSVCVYGTMSLSLSTERDLMLCLQGRADSEEHLNGAEWGNRTSEG